MLSCLAEKIKIDFYHYEKEIEAINFKPNNKSKTKNLNI